MQAYRINLCPENTVFPIDAPQNKVLYVMKWSWSFGITIFWLLFNVSS